MKKIVLFVLMACIVMVSAISATANNDCHKETIVYLTMEVTLLKRMTDHHYDTVNGRINGMTREELIAMGENTIAMLKKLKCH